MFVRICLAICLSVVASQAIGDVISGTVVDDDTNDPIGDVAIKVVGVDTGTTYSSNDVRTDKTTGAFTATIPDVTEPIIVRFRPPEGFAPDFVRLLSGDRTQQINKVLSAGPGHPAPAIGDKPLPVADVRRRFSNGLNKLLTFEALYYQIKELEELDAFDRGLMQDIRRYIEGMAGYASAPASLKTTITIKAYKDKMKVLAGLYNAKRPPEVKHACVTVRKCFRFRRRCCRRR